MRILEILATYPQLSHTYESSELRSLWPRHEMSVVALRPPEVFDEEHLPYESAPACACGPMQPMYSPGSQGFDECCRALKDVARTIRPRVMHTHYLSMAPVLHEVATSLGLPFTVRTHSVDVLGATFGRLRFLQEYVNDPTCLGVIAFPFVKPVLTTAGAREDKVHECFPVVDFDRFYNPGRNEVGILNVGVASPKKNMQGFLELATRLTSMPVSLYAMGPGTPKLRALNLLLGSPADIPDPVRHSEMPRVYKQHNWLIYTASRKVGTVGWPVAIAEAQAAGVGVCVEGIRDDLNDYVGEAGFVLDDLNDALDIVAQPVPSDMREAGFEQARRSDIRRHQSILEELWR